MRVLALNHTRAVGKTFAITRPLDAPEITQLSRRAFNEGIGLEAAGKLLPQLRLNGSLSLFTFTLRLFAQGGVREGNVADLASHCHGGWTGVTADDVGKKANFRDRYLTALDVRYPLKDWTSEDRTMNGALDQFIRPLLNRRSSSEIRSALANKPAEFVQIFLAAYNRGVRARRAYCGDISDAFCSLPTGSALDLAALYLIATEVYKFGRLEITLSSMDGAERETALLAKEISKIDVMAVLKTAQIQGVFSLPSKLLARIFPRAINCNLLPPIKMPIKKGEVLIEPFDLEMMPLDDLIIPVNGSPGSRFKDVLHFGGHPTKPRSTVNAVRSMEIGRLLYAFLGDECAGSVGCTLTMDETGAVKKAEVARIDAYIKGKGIGRALNEAATMLAGLNGATKMHPAEAAWDTEAPWFWTKLGEEGVNTEKYMRRVLVRYRKLTAS